MFSQFDQRLAALEEQHKDVVSRLQESHFQVSCLRSEILELREENAELKKITDRKLKILFKNCDHAIECLNILHEVNLFKLEINSMLTEEIIFCAEMSFKDFKDCYGKVFQFKSGTETKDCVCWESGTKFIGKISTANSYNGLKISSKCLTKGDHENGLLKNGIRIFRGFEVEKGNFVNGHLHGVGQRLFCNGNMQVGYFKCGKFSYGCFFNKTSGLHNLYTGRFNTYDFSADGTFKGDLENGKWSGGEFEFEDESIHHELCVLTNFTEHDIDIFDEDEDEEN